LGLAQDASQSHRDQPAAWHSPLRSVPGAPTEREQFSPVSLLASCINGTSLSKGLSERQLGRHGENGCCRWRTCLPSAMNFSFSVSPCGAALVDDNAELSSTSPLILEGQTGSSMICQTPIDGFRSGLPSVVQRTSFLIPPLLRVGRISGILGGHNFRGIRGTPRKGGQAIFEGLGRQLR
jgi:hypothetical protein